ncbi:hypothetical protein [Mangrovicoccus ximenensis]|uniref:hypothetical protein n=1 Tax=Mangrovicoccus ximenensis TaxID=1911570 RepID=UPI00137511A0|nr:hypothetical protein [Mangrovicoccus ximenensis]
MAASPDLSLRRANPIRRREASVAGRTGSLRRLAMVGGLAAGGGAPWAEMAALGLGLGGAAWRLERKFL